MSALGKLTGDVLAELSSVAAFFDDPITRASGCADEFAPSVCGRAHERIVRLLDVGGFADAQSFVEAVERATSPRWAYFAGLYELIES